LQILNARFNPSSRVKIVPYYTACFSLGTALSFLFMSFCLTRVEANVAAFLAAISALVSVGIIAGIVPPLKTKPALKKTSVFSKFKLVFSNPVNVAYTISYAGHNFELFAYRTWTFTLIMFLGTKYQEGVLENTAGIILSIMILSGILASLFGAKLCLVFSRQKIIRIIALLSAMLAIASGYSLNSPVWLILSLLSFYYLAIMSDSGALTAGIVENSDDHNRGAILASYSMFGFIGCVIGPPIIGLVLDWNGGVGENDAWKFALITMATGSVCVFLIQHWASLNKD
jgi:MFS family permease